MCGVCLTRPYGTRRLNYILYRKYKGEKAAPVGQKRCQMTRTLFVLKEVGDFAPGAFENTAVEDGSIQLGRSGGAYLHSGCYTSPAYRADAFLRLRPSWNAATPKGTAIEVQVRIASNGEWSRWFSFGKWSPFIDRTSPPPQQDEVAANTAEGLSLAEGHAPADTAQIRIYLYSDDQQATPKVYLLGMTVDPLRREREDASRTERLLQLPVYACLRRDPAVADRIATPTTLCMLLNRWGEDALPEEVARASYDSGTGSFGNLSFATAIAGAYGHRCYLQYGGMELLRQQVRRGNAVAAQVHYRAPALGDAQPGSTPAHNAASLPVLEDAVADSYGHLVAVRGFARKDGEEWVVLNDPLQKSDEMVMREMPLAQFGEIYTGICLVLQSGPKGAGAAAPKRWMAELRVDERGDIKLSSHGEEIYPGEAGSAKVVTLCYTLPESIAYASAAQKMFYYIEPNENGRLCVDAEALAGKKTAFYFISSRGETWVTEKTLPLPAVREEPKEEEE